MKEEAERIRQVRAERRRQDAEAIRLMQEEMAERIKQEKENAEKKFSNDHMANLSANFSNINPIPLAKPLPSNRDSSNVFDGDNNFNDNPDFTANDFDGDNNFNDNPDFTANDFSDYSNLITTLISQSAPLTNTDFNTPLRRGSLRRRVQQHNDTA
ncbi:hypothetical protein AGMMS49921_12180 [Endomicrobiia bacterium]|nr:hypothetical protein AGMMS49921_12180 [Endomicrobiia bacterium]